MHVLKYVLIAQVHLNPFGLIVHGLEAVIDRQPYNTKTLQNYINTQRCDWWATFLS